MKSIQTGRLRLIPLTLEQLQNYIANPEALEQELGFQVSRENVTDRLRRAIAMKVEKMERIAPTEHEWYTYWLIVVKDSPFGAGLAGFKGLPDVQGQAEIGYGIDPAYQNKGYMTEAVKGLITWAFQDPRCKAVIAPNTKKWNVASNSVLQKVGMRVYGETEDALDWRIDKVEVSMIQMLIQVAAGSCDRKIYNERTLEYLETRTGSRPYPYSYGFIIGTRTEDDACVDCYLITGDKVTSGTIVECEPVGLLLQDENGEMDHKVLAAIPGQAVEAGHQLLQELQEFIYASFGEYPVRVGPILPREAALEYIEKSALE